MFSPKIFPVLLSALGVLWMVSSIASPVLAARPFWADKTSYIEGDYLYVVGRVSHTTSIEDGKAQALVHGKIALMNAAKISEVSAEGLTLEVRHSYIDNHPDGTMTVYQLLRLPTTKVVEVQNRLRAEGAKQKKAFEEAREELVMLQSTLLQQKQDLEGRTLSIEQGLVSLRILQESLKGKTVEIDQRQSEIVNLKLKLEEKIKTIHHDEEVVEELLPQLERVNQTQMATLKRLQDMEKEFENTEAETSRLHQSILDRIETVSLKACEYISAGMTPEEVKKILGPPSGEKHAYKNERYDTWSYGTVQVTFDSQAVVDTVTGCPK